MKFYNIQTVSQMCGLSAHCIRAWEKRYGAIKPQRADNGRRLYTEQELNRLIVLGKLSSLGNSISLIANLPDEELHKLLERMSQGKDMVFKPVLSKGLIEPGIYLNNMFLALNAWKLDVLTHELNKASMDLSCRDFALEVMGGLFRKVGEYVMSGKMSIAQEHTLSALTKFYIGKRIGQHYLADNKTSFKITLATPAGEQHSIGLMLSALLMAEHGINFVYLGEDLPEESIAEAAIATHSNAILLAVSPSYKNRDINAVATNLKRKLSPGMQLWLGGAVEQLRPGTIKDSSLSTFETLGALDEKLLRLVRAE